MLVVYNGKIVTNSKVIQGKILIIKDDKIADIQDEKKLFNYRDEKLIDAKGGYILPGLIDIHSDIIKKIIVPRKGLVFDYTLALMQVDRMLINQGVTTVYHALSFADSTVFNQNSTLSISNMAGIAVAINKTPKLLINHKFHARLELSSVNAVEILLEMMQNNEVHELSFMNHAPGQGQYTDVESFKREVAIRNAGISEKEKNEIVQICQSKRKITDDRIQELINLANEKCIPMAYHDVSEIEKLSWMEKNNIKICEFPLNLKVAKEAINKKLYSVCGCPNILNKKSHNNNSSAIDGILQGGINIISSDYFPYGLLYSVFQLIFDYHVPIEKAVLLVTLNPAKALNISNMYGSISIGKYADVIVVECINGLPVVKYVVKAGVLVSAIGK